MASDAVEGVEKRPDSCPCKVPFSMCRELQKFVLRIRGLLLTIEEARPAGVSGIKALSSLDIAILKATNFIKSCTESSRLYLVVKADDRVSKCQHYKKLLEESLGELQTMVHPKLAQEISLVMDDLRNASFALDSSEEAAAKAMERVIWQPTSASEPDETSEVLKALQLSASAFHVTSTKAVWAENEAIKKKIKEVGKSDAKKRQVLNFLRNMLKTYGNSISKEQSHDDCSQNEGEFAFENRNCSTYCQSVHEAQVDIQSRATPPVEFMCPISSRLMSDPVIIASGQTFERKNIQMWFDEGNDTCPQTKMKLPHLSLTPNVAMKDLISKWCRTNGVVIPDPTMLSAEVVPSWEISSTSTSTSSFSSSMNDLSLRMELSNTSLGSLDSSFTSDSSQTTMADGLYLISYLDFLPKLHEFQWESQCKVVEDVKRHLDQNDEASRHPPAKCVEPVVRFLKDAHGQHDVKAQKAGSQLLLALLNKKRSGIMHLHEEAYCLFAAFLDSDVIEEALDIVEVLSGHQHCRPNILASGAFTSILKILDSNDKRSQERAIKILCNLSLTSEACIHFVYLGGIPKLVSLLVDSSLAGSCLHLLKNLCVTEEGRVSVAETNGCIASVAALLASGSHEDQENALAFLLPLCSQRVQYCQLLMDEDVAAALDVISVNGNDKARASAMELRRLLKDTNDQQCTGSYTDASRDSKDLSKERKSSKGSRLAGRISFFSNPTSLATGKKK